jgi:hypothetical protein
VPRLIYPDSLTKLPWPTSLHRNLDMSKSQIRKTAYKYIKGQLSKLHGCSYDAESPLIIPLNELMLLKEGLADPSAELVALLKQLLKGASTDAEIEARLVAPFKQRKVD